MKITKPILLFIGILIVSSSCKKELNENKETETLKGTLAKVYRGNSGNVNNNITIISSYLADFFNRDSAYISFAFGKISYNGIPANAGLISIGNVVLTPNANNIYNYSYSLIEGKALLGASILLKAPLILNNTSSSLGATVIPVPKELFPSSIAIPKDFINRLFPDSIYWSPDTNNQFKMVQIQLSYFKGLSQGNIPSLPDAIDDLIYTVTDNGNFIIPTIDLKRFPKGSFVGLSISRAFNKTVGGIAYIAVTEAHTIPLLIEE